MKDEDPINDSALNEGDRELKQYLDPLIKQAGPEGS